MMMKTMLLSINHLGIIITKKILQTLLNVERKMNVKFNLKKHNNLIVKSTKFYDMVDSADERYYLGQYFQIIRPYIEDLAHCRDHKLRVLDLGCGQGRFTVPLAEAFRDSEIIGVDISPSVIQKAKSNSRHVSHNTTYVSSDIASYVAKLEKQSVDVVLLLEVLYFLPDYEMILNQVVEAIKPGGLIIMGFRSQYFNIMYSIQNRLWFALSSLLEQRSGKLWGSQVWFNWHTSSEVTNLVSMLKLDLKELHGVGGCSGLPNDPHSFIVMPSQLSNIEQESLGRVEQYFGKELPDTGRYMVAIARKP